MTWTRCLFIKDSLTLKMLGEGKLEELLEEMPTGQEELTRERRERLKEVFLIFSCFLHGSRNLYHMFFLYERLDEDLFLLFQAKDCLLKTIGEDAKRLVRFTCFNALIREGCKKGPFSIPCLLGGRGGGGYSKVY